MTGSNRPSIQVMVTQYLCRTSINLNQPASTIPGVVHYSCLAQLKQLDMDGLKIDRAFTSQLLNGRTDAALFEAIVAMAHALDMRVVAEGVETAEQLAALQSLGCEEVQGYYISKPVPAVDAAQLLQKRFLFPCARLGV